MFYVITYNVIKDNLMLNFNMKVQGFLDLFCYVNFIYLYEVCKLYFFLDDIILYVLRFELI